MSDKLKPLVGVNDRIKPNLTAAARVGYFPKKAICSWQQTNE